MSLLDIEEFAPSDQDAEANNVANGHALIEFIVHGVLLSIVAIAGSFLFAELY